MSILLGAAPVAGGCEERAAGIGAVEPAKSVAFGAAWPGFVSWLSVGGEVAVVRAFDRDTDADGRLDPRFGIHGEPEGDRPRVHVYELRARKGRIVDEVVATDPMGRWLVWLDGGQLVLHHAPDGASEVLAGAVVAGDEANPCMSPRQASIDPSGRFLVYMRQRDPFADVRVVVRELATGRERALRSSGPQWQIWRAEAAPAGWVVLREAAAGEDLPRQRTTCACHWCRPFAGSVGSYGWDGKFRTVWVDPGGGRHDELQGRLLPVDSRALWDLAEERLVTVAEKAVAQAAVAQAAAKDAAPVALGPGCRVESVALGVVPGRGGVLVDCPAGDLVLSPDTGRRVVLEEDVRPVLDPSPVFDGRIGVELRAASKQGRPRRRAASLRLKDGSVHAGPEGRFLGAPHASGWLLVGDEARVAAFDVASGASTPIDVEGAKSAKGLALRTLTHWWVVDPQSGRSRATDREPRLVSARGCVVEGARHAKIEKGPWRLSCP